MDTRTKIVEPHAIPRHGGPITLVTGYFDPVHADTVRRLNACRAPGHLLVVAVAEPDAPVLPWRARAELIAGLACVDYVIDEAQAHGVAAARQVDDRAADARSREALIRQIISRHETA